MHFLRLFLPLIIAIASSIFANANDDVASQSININGYTINPTVEDIPFSGFSGCVQIKITLVKNQAPKDNVSSYVTVNNIVQALNRDIYYFYLKGEKTNYSLSSSATPIVNSYGEYQEITFGLTTQILYKYPGLYSLTFPEGFFVSADGEYCNPETTVYLRIGNAPQMVNFYLPASFDLEHQLPAVVESDTVFTPGSYTLAERLTDACGDLSMNVEMLLNEEWAAGINENDLKNYREQCKLELTDERQLLLHTHIPGRYRVTLSSEASDEFEAGEAESLITVRPSFSNLDLEYVDEKGSGRDELVLLSNHDYTHTQLWLGYQGELYYRVTYNDSTADPYTYSTTQEGIATYSSDDDDADSDLTGMQLYDRNYINLNNATRLELVAKVNGVLSERKPMTISYIADTTGIELIAPATSDSQASDASTVHHYNLLGQPISPAEPGLHIIHTPAGSHKVLIP